jgi:hypothetical protein
MYVSLFEALFTKTYNYYALLLQKNKKTLIFFNIKGDTEHVCVVVILQIHIWDLPIKNLCRNP